MLHLFDNSGDKTFNYTFYGNTYCVILFFDLTEPTSFESVENWREDFLNAINPKYPESFPFILIGNKCDEVNNRKVPYEKINEYCKSKSISAYFETSAKDNPNIIEVFDETAKLGYKRYLKLLDDFIFSPNEEKNK